MRTVALLAAALASAPQAASAFACKEAPAYPDLALLWPERALGYGVHAPSGVDPAVVQAAFLAWQAPACSDVTFTYVGLVSAADPVSQVSALDVGWAGAGFPPDAVAITETAFDPETGQIQAADIVLNRESFVFVDVEAGCAGETYDTLAVITHEVGHFVGLGHTRAFDGGAADPTMAPQVEACDASKRTLEADDVAGLCHLYAAGAPARGCDADPELTLDPLVDGPAGGCAAARGGGSVALALAWIGAFGARRRRRSDTCPRVRSAG